MRLENAWLTTIISNNRLIALIIPGNFSLKKFE